jgi:hypothetical protein
MNLFVEPFLPQLRCIENVQDLVDGVWQLSSRESWYASVTGLQGWSVKD